MVRPKLSVAILLFASISLAGCSHHSDATLSEDSFRVTSVKILSGPDSHVSDADTYIVQAMGPHSTIQAEGYDEIRTGEKLCAGFGTLLYTAWDATKPCSDANNINGKAQFKMLSEQQRQ